MATKRFKAEQIVTLLGRSKESWRMVRPPRKPARKLRSPYRPTNAGGRNTADRSWIKRNG
jgi:hypothetical protein